MEKNTKEIKSLSKFDKSTSCDIVNKTAVQV